MSPGVGGLNPGLVPCIPLGKIPPRLRPHAIIPSIVLAAAAFAQEPEEAKPSPSPFAGGLLICAPNSPGSPEAARPVMERLGAYLTTRLGAPCQPVYFNRAEPARQWIEKSPPRFAILSLDLWLRWREELSLVPIAQAERAGKTGEKLHVIVRGESTAKSLEDLLPDKLGRRAVFWSSHLEDARFAARVAFAGGIEAEGEKSQVQLLATHQPLKVLRRLKAGEQFEGHAVDAVVVDDAVWAALEKVPELARALREVHVTEPLPTPPVVAFPSATSEERAKLVAVLQKMGEDEEGKELLSTLQVSGFRAPDLAALDATVASYAQEAR